MDKTVGIDFFEFTSPGFGTVSEQMFLSVKESYGIDVLDTVTAVAHEHPNDVLKLVNLIIPGVRTVLALSLIHI